MKKFRLLFLVSLLAWSCGGELLLPKPRIYPKVVLPQGDAVPFEEEACHFRFKRPTYTKVIFENDRSPLFEAHDPCWFDLTYPELNCAVHFSYYAITETNPLEKLHNDAYRLTNEHNKKATYIEELKVQNEHDVKGTIFDLEGPVASPFQFYLTDSSQHFLRGALYFKTQVRPDSLAP
nr:hypothetical protein [Saprospiraceae bacterium]